MTLDAGIRQPNGFIIGVLPREAPDPCRDYRSPVITTVGRYTTTLGRQSIYRTVNVKSGALLGFQYSPFRL